MMSPQDIALEYNGNKQKIAAAVQAGIIDPTSGVMAGMFIDRIRATAAQEQVTPTTVEQDVLGAPQMPAQSAALGATPQAQQLAQGQARAMQAMPPTERGLAALPVDESMVPGGENYAGGGIVAFAGDDEDVGSLVDLSNLAELERRRMRNLPAGEDKTSETVTETVPAVPGYTDIKSGKAASLADLISAATERRRAVPLSEGELAAENYYKTAGTKAAEAKSRGFNEFLAEMGFRAAASKSPRALQAFGEAGAGAMPRITAAAKEARELEEAAIKGRAELGRARRLEELAGITAGEKAFATQEENVARLAAARLGQREINAAERLMKEKPGMSFLDALTSVSQAMHPKDTYNATRTAVTAAGTATNTLFQNLIMTDATTRDLYKKAIGGDEAAAAKIKEIQDKIQKDVFARMQVEGVDLSSGRLGPAAGGRGGPSSGQVDTSNPLLR